MSKEKMRNRLAALSFSEKIKILEKLRDRSRAIAASRKKSRASDLRSPEVDQEVEATPRDGRIT